MNLTRYKQAAYIDQCFGLQTNLFNMLQRWRASKCSACPQISTGFVESTINQLVAKRFVKKQQMRWTPRGAHLLLQIRVQALNDDLQTSFNRSYPKLGRPCEEKLAA